MSDAYPLRWPPQRPRRTHRKHGRFGTHERSFAALSVAEATRRLQSELDLIRARFTVLSTNIELRLDGLPRSGQREPADPGVAVYFHVGDKSICLPCDTYDRVADNIAAVAAHIRATRAIARHGVATVGEMFAGFLALPSPDQSRTWREVLELHRAPQVTRQMIEDAYRRLARERHPDHGGSDSMMAELNHARAAARMDLAK